MEGLIQGKYRILHEIGQGGMAVVYKGFDTALERDVAIKVLHPHLASRADSRMRLQREAKAVAKLHHPNILEIYDYSGADSDKSFIVTEYIRGETLKECFERHQPILPEVGAMVLYEIAGAVAHAHDTGIIHRDIKPENIMIRDDGVLKLMDFGIAQITDLQAMTVTGALVGSPAHMSPEHVEGKALDWRADIFSLGTLLYTLCAGRLPFESPSPHALLRQILESRYDDPRVHNPAISRRLFGIITKCLRRDPDERFDTARALQDEIGGYLRELGFTDPAAELRDYFEDPPSGEQTLTRRTVDRLMELARSEAAEGRVAAALERYNQVLALEGDRADAMEELQRLSNSKSRTALLRRVGAGLLIAAGVAAVVWSTEWTGGSGTPEALPAAPPVAALAPTPVTVEAIVPEALPPAPAAVRLPAAMREADDSLARLYERRTQALYATAPAAVAAHSPAAKPRPTEVRRPVRPAGPSAIGQPTGVTFMLHAIHGGSLAFQGVTYADGKSPKLTLPPGRYEVRVWKPGVEGTFEVREMVTVSPGMKEVRQVMYGIEPCRVTIDAPQGARIRIGEHTLAPGGTVELKLTSPRQRAQASVQLAGHKEAQVKLDLTPGCTIRRRAELEPLPDP